MLTRFFLIQFFVMIGMLERKTFLLASFASARNLYRDLPHLGTLSSYWSTQSGGKMETPAWRFLARPPTRKKWKRSTHPLFYSASIIKSEWIQPPPSLALYKRELFPLKFIRDSKLSSVCQWIIHCEAFRSSANVFNVCSCDSRRTIRVSLTSPTKRQ